MKMPILKPRPLAKNLSGLRTRLNLTPGPTPEAYPSQRHLQSCPIIHGYSFLCAWLQIIIVLFDIIPLDKNTIITLHWIFVPSLGFRSCEGCIDHNFDFLIPYQEFNAELICLCHTMCYLPSVFLFVQSFRPKIIL